MAIDGEAHSWVTRLALPPGLVYALLAALIFAEFRHVVRRCRGRHRHARHVLRAIGRGPKVLDYGDCCGGVWCATRRVRTTRRAYSTFGARTPWRSYAVYSFAAGLSALVAPAIVAALVGALHYLGIMWLFAALCLIGAGLTWFLQIPGGEASARSALSQGSDG